MQYRTLVRPEGAAGSVSRARGPAGAGAVGGVAIALHGAVRGDGDRLPDGGELRGGGPPVPVELGPGGGIQERAVRRGLSRRAVAAAPVVGVDETSFQRRHEYVTVVNDLTTPEPRVLYVAERALPRGPGRLLRRGGRCGLRADPDGGDGHVAGLRRVGARAHGGVDRVRQVVQHLGAAVDQVRRSENRILRQQGDDRLVKTRYLWPTRRGNLTQQQRRAFTPLRRSSSRGACVRDQGTGDAVVGTTAPGAGRSGCGGAGTGGPFAVAAATDQEGRADYQAALGRSARRRPDERHERALRGDQRQDPVDQAARLWLPQPRALPQRHLLPPGRLDLYPDAVGAHPKS